MYVGDWKNDKREGHGEYYWKKGDKYDGDWKNDKREGRGKKIYKNYGEYHICLNITNKIIIKKA